MSGAYFDAGEIVAGRFEILREIGRGGYSVVYAAADRQVGTEVAIKLLVPPPLVAHVARERLRREVEAARMLSHPNIVAVYDLLDDNGRSCVVMELVNGVDLAVRAATTAPMSADEVASIGASIADALETAHRHGILHRDVKPQNVLVERDGHVRLTDFGSAKLESQATMTQTGAFVGTISYTAPEVIAGRRGDARADIYGLGATLYFALIDALPPRPSPHLPPTPVPGGHHPRAVRPDIPEWLDAVVARMTTADPSHRYPAASAVADALRRGSADGPYAINRSAERSRWRRIPAPYYVMLALVFSVGTAAGLIAHQRYYLWVSPVMATVLAAGAFMATARAAEGLPPMWALPRAVRRRVIDAVRRLAPGTARSLLVDVVTLAAFPATRSERRERDLAELVTTACDAAMDLDQFDQALMLLTSRHNHSREAIARAEAARDRIVQRFLDAITVVGAAGSQEILRSDAESRLTEATTELTRTVKVEAAAAREIAALIG